MIKFSSFTGIVTAIEDMNEASSSGCDKLMVIIDHTGKQVNFVVKPDTYFVNHEVVRVGDYITGYYDSNAPVILIYPPQYLAIVMARYNSSYSVKVDYFDSDLLSSDGQLKLNLAASTKIMLKNDQPFYDNIANRNLVVIYTTTTRSIPPQTTPQEIIVWCEN